MTRFDSLQEWLRWQEGLHSSSIDLDLTRVREVAGKMGLLHPSAKVVTVAGTNGKGSCVATLEALLLADGTSVGAFTSPHFHRYNERIRVNGVEASDEMIVASFERIDEARGDISLTYFEFGTLAAIDICRQQKLQVMVLEVGLGGRLDAVNIIDADVAIVTSIGLDHESWLGSDLQQIGREKAGIYRPSRWALCADQQAPDSVRATASELGARWIGMGTEMQASPAVDKESWFWRGLDADGRSVELANLPLANLPLASVAAAMQAFVLLGHSLGGGLQLCSLLQSLSLPGRSQVIERAGIRFILDVAHNPAAARFQAERLAAAASTGKTHALCAIMADKDRRGIFEVLLSGIDEWHVCGLPDNDRAASVAMLQQDLRQLGCKARAHTSVEGGLRALLASANSGDRVLVMGSFFTIAAAQSFFNQNAH